MVRDAVEKGAASRICTDARGARFIYIDKVCKLQKAYRSNIKKLVISAVPTPDMEEQKKDWSRMILPVRQWLAKQKGVKILNGAAPPGQMSRLLQGYLENGRLEAIQPKNKDGMDGDEE